MAFVFCPINCLWFALVTIMLRANESLLQLFPLKNDYDWDIDFNSTGAVTFWNFDPKDSLNPTFMKNNMSLSPHRL